MPSKSNPIIVILLIAILAVVGYMAFGKKEKVVAPVPEVPAETPENPAPNPTPTPEPEPKPTLPEMVTKIGQEFVIRKGETFTIAGGLGGTFTLTDFYYHPCPKGAMCIWSGLDIFYEIKIGADVYVKDKPRQDVSGAPYIVSVKDSDYQTYAKIVIDKK